MYKWITNNLGLKILSLLLAIGIWTWFYKSGVIISGAERERYYSLSEMSSKNVPIKVVLIGNPPKGYFVNFKGLSLSPASFLLIGPRKLIEQIEFVKTQPIDISEFSKTFATKVSLQSIADINLPDEEFVEVIIPIEKVESK